MWKMHPGHEEAGVFNHQLSVIGKEYQVFLIGNHGVSSQINAECLENMTRTSAASLAGHDVPLT